MTGEGFGAERVVDVVCPRSHSRQAVQVRGGDVVDVVPPESVHGHQEDLTAAGVYPQPQDQEEEHGHRHAVEGGCQFGDRGDVHSPISRQSMLTNHT